MFKYLLYKLGLFFINRLSIKSSYKLASAVSDIQWFFSFRDRKAVKANLSKMLPEDAGASDQSREVFRNFGRYLVEFFQMNKMVNDHFIKEHVRIRGTEHLDNALKEGKGGIVVTAHIGNWEMGAVLLSVLGYPIKAVALPHRERPVNELFNRQREEKGVSVIPTNTALRRCIEQLRNNKFVGLVADRDFTNNGIVMEFLGQKALIPKGAAMFSLKTGAPIIPVFLIRNDDGSFNLTAHSPIRPPQRRPETQVDDVILGIMERYVSVIEQEIRKNPSQWLLFREFSAQ